MKRRKIFSDLLLEKNSKKITILIGSRQVGKTTILKALKDELSKEFRTLFLDLDIFSNYEKVSSFENLTNYLKLNGYKEDQKHFFYLFLDEFQRYKDLSIILKNVYDNYTNIKIYASGSSSLTIKSQVQESLAGRKKIFHIYPLDFMEFLWFGDKQEEVEQLSNLSELRGSKLHNITLNLQILLEEHLVFGGYPEVVLQKNNRQKVEVLESIFDLYVKKDLVEYLNIKKILEGKKILEYLAINHGNKIKYEEISQISTLRFQEVKNYIEILKETFLIQILKPYYTNKNKELVKIPKIYFVDNGVRNYFINNFNKLDLREDKSALLECFIITEILKKRINETNLKFWQDKNKHEVDLIVDTIQNQTSIEIKYKTRLKNKDTIGLQKFAALYPKTTGHLVNFSIQEKREDIEFLLPYSIQSIF